MARTSSTHAQKRASDVASASQSPNRLRSCLGPGPANQFDFPLKSTYFEKEGAGEFSIISENEPPARAPAQLKASTA